MDIQLLLPIIVLLMIVPLFLSSRKQRRVQTQMQQLQSSLEPGDVVSTTSGLRGTVVDSSYEETVDLEIADGVVTTWLRAAIREKITVDEHAHPVTPDEPVAGPSLEKAPLEVGPAAETGPSLEKAPAEEPVTQPAAVRENESTNGSTRI